MNAQTKIDFAFQLSEVNTENNDKQKLSYFLRTISYPKEARGWVDGVYYSREEIIDTYEENQFPQISRIYAIESLVWTETEETGFGVYQYEETTEIHIPLPNENYEVSVILTNPADHSYKACIKGNKLQKVESVLIEDGEVEVSFPICIVDGLLCLRILPEFMDTSKETSTLKKVFIKDIIVKKVETIATTIKPFLFLASDSTVQTYDKSTAPQTGWGEVFVQSFVNHAEEYKLVSPKVYETKDLIIQNRAIGGRSSKSFLLEGRLDAILKDIKPGDYVFVQFGHNDATAARPNRYVDSREFGDYIRYYINGAKQRNATCVLVTPVARRNCNEETGEFSISFHSYREVMISLSEELDVPLLDLGKASTEYLNTIGAEESKKLFLWVDKGEYPDSIYKEGVCDNTHLQLKGALIFARLVADLIKDYKKDDKLFALQNILSCYHR